MRHAPTPERDSPHNPKAPHGLRPLQRSLHLHGLDAISLRLGKRLRLLGLERNRFTICTTEVSNGYARGWTAMHELTFANLRCGECI